MPAAAVAIFGARTGSSRRHAPVKSIAAVPKSIAATIGIERGRRSDATGATVARGRDTGETQ
jgi:hypothetical protein